MNFDNYSTLTNSTQIIQENIFSLRTKNTGSLFQIQINYTDYCKHIIQINAFKLNESGEKEKSIPNKSFIANYSLHELNNISPYLGKMDSIISIFKELLMIIKLGSHELYENNNILTLILTANKLNDWNYKIPFILMGTEENKKKNEDNLEIKEQNEKNRKIENENVKIKEANENEEFHIVIDNQNLADYDGDTINNDNYKDKNNIQLNKKRIIKRTVLEKEIGDISIYNENIMEEEEKNPKYGKKLNNKNPSFNKRNAKSDNIKVTYYKRETGRNKPKIIDLSEDENQESEYYILKE